MRIVHLATSGVITGPAEAKVWHGSDAKQNSTGFFDTAMENTFGIKPFWHLPCHNWSIRGTGWVFHQITVAGVRDKAFGFKVGFAGERHAKEGFGFGKLGLFSH